MTPIAARELANWLGDPQRARPLLLDVREPWETAICRIEGAELAPLSHFGEYLARIGQERPIVCICHHGVRSAYVANVLEQNGWRDVHNLTGGIDAWAREVDPSMPSY